MRFPEAIGTGPADDTLDHCRVVHTFVKVQSIVEALCPDLKVRFAERRHIGLERIPHELGQTIRLGINGQFCFSLFLLLNRLGVCSISEGRRERNGIAGKDRGRRGKVRRGKERA